MGKKISITQLREDLPGFSMYGVDISDPLSCIGSVTFFDTAEVLRTISPTLVLQSGDAYMMFRDIVDIECSERDSVTTYKIQCVNHFTSIPLQLKIICSL